MITLEDCLVTTVFGKFRNLRRQPSLVNGVSFREIGKRWSTWLLNWANSFANTSLGLARRRCPSASKSKPTFSFLLGLSCWSSIIRPSKVVWFTWVNGPAIPLRETVIAIVDTAIVWLGLIPSWSSAHYPWHLGSVVLNCCEREFVIRHFAADPLR